MLGALVLAIGLVIFVDNIYLEGEAGIAEKYQRQNSEFTKLEFSSSNFNVGAEQLKFEVKSPREKLESSIVLSSKETQCLSQDELRNDIRQVTITDCEG